MKINKLSLPYPILMNERDDIKGTYTVNLSYELVNNTTTLYVEHDVENDSIQNLLNEGAAEFCVEVRCPQTFFRKTFCSSGKKQQIEIPSKDLRNKTVVYFFITAKEEISAYAPKEMNEEYSKYTFSLEKGDVMGYGGESNIFIAKDWRELMAVTSFMEVEPNKEINEGPILIELSQNKIIVKMPNNDYPKYQLYNAGKAYYPLFHASIVLPVLIVALSYIGSSDTQYENSQWYQNLDFKINESPELRSIGLESMENVSKIAQLILKYPISRAIKGIDIMQKEEQQREE